MIVIVHYIDKKMKDRKIMDVQKITESHKSIFFQQGMTNCSVNRINVEYIEVFILPSSGT
jgi:hypothetical protein